MNKLLSVLVLFILLYLGINIRASIILGIVELVIVLAFAFYRFGKKIFIIGMISCSIGVGLSFIRPQFDKSEYSGIVEEVKEYLQQNTKFEEIYETTAGSTITSHCGNHTIGILYLNDGNQQ